MQSYGIGGNEVPAGASEAFAAIPENRTLLIEKLTDETPLKPVIVRDLKSTDEVFRYYKPGVRVEFESREGWPKYEELRFGHLKDFEVEGITNQSAFLQQLTGERDEYQKIIRKVRSDKVLESVVADPEKRRALLQALRAMIRELHHADRK